MIAPLPWTRYWIIARPGDRSATAGTNPPVRRTTVELSQTPCVVMLGLPGMGKTTEMMVLARLARELGEYSDFISLGLVPARAELERRLQESPGRKAWAGGSEWAIHLDGLDEAVIEQGDLIAALDESFRVVLADLTPMPAVEKQDRLDRLKVRISCRAAEWPDSRSTVLRSLFGDGVEIVQLEELEPEDAEQAAEQAGISSPDWQDILEKLDNADALTRRPITLRLLLSIYEQSGDVPTGQVPLYHRGILALLEEANELRRRNGLVGRLDTGSRLLVAARIAAATTFSGSVSVGISAGSSDPDSVLVAEIAGGVEAIAGEGFRVGEPEIVELLRTALFVPVSDTKFTWVHRTFSEFLAAYYLVERGLSSDQLLEFLGSAQDPDQRIPPQLHEVAAWVASMRGDFFKALLSRQPIILLGSDIAAASDGDRSNLVRQLLDDFDHGRLFDNDWNLRRKYSKLRHPGLRDDLLPYLVDKDHSPIARRVAIRIADECDEKSLADDLVSMALDPDEQVHLRAQAVIALGDLGTAETRAKLKPLAFPGDPADEDDELRGWSLAALWPGLISFGELLQALTPRKRSNLIGGYWRFQHYLELTLSPEESVKAVQWVRDRVSREDDDDDLLSRKLLATMLSAAWRNAADSRVIEVFAAFSVAANGYEAPRLVHSSEFGAFVDTFRSGNAAYRRRLAEIVLGRQGEEGRAAQLSIYGRWPLLVPGDMPWLLQQLHADDRTLPVGRLIEAIVALVHVDGIAGHDDVWLAAETNKELADALTLRFTTDLESSLARFSRRERQEPAAQDQPAFDLKDEAAKRLARAHVDEWWEFNLLFFANDHGRFRGDEFSTDLADQELWRLLTPAQHLAVIDWAEAYLTQDKPPQRDWLGTNTLHRPAMAAYRAFRLLLLQAPDRFEALDPVVWGRWAHAILATPANDDQLGSRIRAELVVRAYQMAQRPFLAMLARLLIRSAAEKSLSETLDRLERAYDERIATLLWKVTIRPKTPPAPRLELLRFLVRRNYAMVRSAVVAAMSGDDTDELPVLDEAGVNSLAGEFLFRFPSDAWPHLVRLDASEPQRARAIFLEAHTLHAMGSFPIADFTAAELRDLYLWIEANFPPPPEDRDGGARWLGPADRIQGTHRAVLDRLVQLGTSAAVDVVRDLATQLPGQLWLKSRLVDAEAAFQLQAWRSPSPGNVLRTIASYGVTLPVRSVKSELEAAALDLLASGASLQPEIELTAPSVDISLAPADPLQSLNILSVATEWNSAHGGLSTLNRDLCIALAKNGHTVSCLVLDASDAERAEADSRGVRLLTCPIEPGVEGTGRLFLVPADALAATGAEFVIGHDHITGPAAHHIAKRILSVPNVHFVHTIPDEIEVHKSSNLYRSAAKGADKADIQLKQCKQADLVIGVGPRIYREIADKLGASPPTAQLRPGLGPPPASAKTPPLSVMFLFQGRFEHAPLKGAQLAFDATALVRSDPALYPWQKPDLVMRGFDKDKFEQQCSGIVDEESLRTFVKPRFFTTEDWSLAADLNGASLLLMPSKKEGFGLVALEAIAAGVPVLMTAESGLAEMLYRDPKIVAVIDPESARRAVCEVEGRSEAAVAAEWAKQMKIVLEDRDAAFARAEQLRKDLSSVLTWDAAARALVDEFGTL